jgi:hypothetical protein
LFLSYSSWAAGGIVLNWGEEYGIWSDDTRGKEFPANWYSTRQNGQVILKDLSAGLYTIGITRAFGLGPLVVPSVGVEDGRTTCVNLSFHTDYYSKPTGESIEGKVIIQPFIAKGVSVVKAGAYFARLPQPRKVKYAILGGDGARLGPEGARPPETNSFVGVWKHGDIPVVPGCMYYLRIESASGNALSIKLGDTSDPLMEVIVDGKRVVGKCLAGFVQSDPPGIYSTKLSLEGVFHPKPERMIAKQDVGQTFIAQGTSLAMVDFRALIPDFEGEVEFDVIVRGGDTKAPKIAERRVRGRNGSILQALWQPGEVVLKPGQLYCIDIRNVNGKPFKISYVPADSWSQGIMYIDDQSVPALADMSIVEYGKDEVAPSPPRIEVLSGDSFARIQYQAPDDMDVRKLQVRYIPGNAIEGWPLNPAQGYLLTEVDVVPGQIGAICHTGLENFDFYTYAVYAVDVNGNYSKPARAGAWPGKGPVLPPQATVLNADFIKAENINVCCPRGWDFWINSGEPDWQIFTELDGSRSFGWRASENTSVSLWQVLALTPGRKYELTLKAKGVQASASIFADNTSSEATVLTNRWFTLKVIFVAQKVETKITITGSTNGAGEIRFKDLKVRDITAL